jgi:hypothetical protein
MRKSSKDHKRDLSHSNSWPSSASQNKPSTKKIPAQVDLGRGSFSDEFSPPRRISKLLPTKLLTLTRNVIVPVHECAIGVVPPRPDMELEERSWDVVPVRDAD